MKPDRNKESLRVLLSLKNHATISKEETYIRLLGLRKVSNSLRTAGYVGNASTTISTAVDLVSDAKRLSLSKIKRDFLNICRTPKRSTLNLPVEMVLEHLLNLINSVLRNFNPKLSKTEHL